jgi:hypothetical protein
LMTNLPASVFVTSLSFACYLLSRFALGPIVMGGERREARARVHVPA